MAEVQEDDSPRFFRASIAARLYVEQLAGDLDDPTEVADRHDALSRVVTKLGIIAHTLDFAHRHLPDSSTATLVGEQLRKALDDEDVPAGIRDIYLGCYRDEPAFVEADI